METRSPSGATCCRGESPIYLLCKCVPALCGQSRARRPLSRSFGAGDRAIREALAGVLGRDPFLIANANDNLEVDNLRSNSSPQAANTRVMRYMIDPTIVSIDQKRFLRCEQHKPPSPSNEVLTPRQTAIIALIEEGYSNKEIARQLKIAPETVKTHVKSIFIKLGVERRAQAVSRARALGLVVEENSSTVDESRSIRVMSFVMLTNDIS
jgi:DNA-binding CsgD family transcriptional regulator